MAEGGRWRWLRAALGAGLVALAAWKVSASWDEFRRTSFAWEVRPAYLLASALVVWTMYALLVLTWRGLVTGWGERLGLAEAARIWTVSSLGKYLPGKVWAVAGMAAMAQRAGVAAWAATGAAVLNQLLALGAGTAAVALTGPDLLAARYPWIRGALLALLAASLAVTALLASPALLRRGLALAGFELGAHAAPSPRALAAAFGANLVAWAGYGASLWLLARGLLPVALPPAAAIGAFAASYIAGFLALLAPGGLGVREGVFILMLQGPLGTPAAVALAVASRLLLTVTEVGAAVPFLLFFRERARAAL